jgi:SAM-dependent MidA family methyltransferase
MEFPNCLQPAPTAATADWPEPDAAARACSDRLVQCLRAQMQQQGGELPFDRFMELALYAPGLGYYAAGSQKFGAAGDFVTAPEISPLFGRALARQCAEVLGHLGAGDVLEFGAGSGALAISLIQELAALKQLPERYWILETSADLRQRQQAAIAGLPSALAARVHWLDGLPDALRGVVLANEVLDAMPVHRFQMVAGVVGEVVVHWDGAAFVERIRPAAAALCAAVDELRRSGCALGDGYASEINLRAKPWSEALARALRQGVALLIDYGYTRQEYYLPERSMGTLMCHYRHRAHADPYWLPGLQDITAHVDFSALAQAATAAGLQVAGYSTQGNFLLGCGLDDILAASDASDVGRHMDLVQQAKRLVLPSAMGERFQVLGLSKAYHQPLSGFALRDRRERL